MAVTGVSLQAVGQGPDLSRFVPRFPWLGGDLQTLRNFLVRPHHELDAWPARRLELPLHDGSGDRLVAQLHEAGEGPGGLVVLVHGLTGCEDSIYIRASTAFWLAKGRSVLRLNLRGAGPSRPLCSQQYHAGRSGDLRDALVALRDDVGVSFEAGLFLVGYSLGANMLLKFLAEDGADLPVTAAVSVSAPIDLKAAQVRLMAWRNWGYHRFLLNGMRADALAAPGTLSAAERQAIEEANSVFAYDDKVVAPRNGFAGAEDYYRRCSGLRFLPAIATPTLLVHSQDDPWIPAESYQRFDWAGQPALRLHLLEAGGHVGFHGRGLEAAWHDLAAEAFLTEVTSKL